MCNFIVTLFCLFLGVILSGQCFLVKQIGHVMTPPCYPCSRSQIKKLVLLIFLVIVNVPSVIGDNTDSHFEVSANDVSDKTVGSIDSGITLDLTNSSDEAKNATVPIAFCERLKLQAGVDGPLTFGEARDYCLHNCSFNSGVICKETTIFDFSFLKNVTQIIETWLKTPYRQKRQVPGLPDLPTQPSGDLIIFLSLLSPILLQTFLMFIYWSLEITTFGPLFFVVLIIYQFVAGTALLAAISILMMFYTIMTTRFRSDNFATYFSSNVVVIVCCVTSWYYRAQVLLSFVLATILFGFVVLVFFKAWKSNRVFDVGVLVYVGALLFYMYLFAMHLWRTLSYRDPVVEIIVLLAKVLIPIGGFTMLWANVLDAAVDFDLLFRPYLSEGSDVNVVIVVFVVAIIAFITARALIASAATPSIRQSEPLQFIGLALYVYMIDVFQWFFLLKLLRQSMTHRRVLYLLACGFEFIVELYYAQDILALRLLFFAFEFVTGYTGLLKHARLLDANINLSFEISSFPQRGSFPAFASDAFVSLKKATVKVCSFAGSSARLGCGILLSSGGSRRLWTVNHVVDGADRIAIDGASPKARVSGSQHSEGLDPIVSIPVDGEFPDHEFASLQPLIPSERKLVRYLLLMSPEGAASVITNFNFDGKGNLQASVDLMRGDSGSPVIAVLSGGIMRYAGAVSMGSSDSGSGNYISLFDQDGVTFTSGRPLEIDVPDWVGVNTQSFRTIVDLLTENKRLAEQFRDRREEKEGGFSRQAEKQFRRKRNDRRRLLENFLINSRFEPQERVDVLDAFDDERILDFNISRGWNQSRRKNFGRQPYPAVGGFDFSKTDEATEESL